MAETLSVYWDPVTWERTRSAYIAQVDDQAGVRHLVDWISRAIATHTARTSAERAELGADVQRGAGGIRKVHLVEEAVLLEVASAQVADRAAGRYMSRSAWICEAAAIAANEIEQQVGRLPPAPERLPSGPRPSG